MSKQIKPSRSVKGYLQSIRSERMEVDYLLDMVEELRTSLLPSGINYDKINVQTSPDSDPMLDVLEKIEKYENKIKEHLQGLLENYNNASQLIMMLEKPEHRQVLCLYYLDKSRLKWSDVAARMNYSEQRIYQFHNEAITILERENKKRTSEKD